MSAWAPKVLPSGNIEVTVELLPEAYAALMAVVGKSKGKNDMNAATVINAALCTLGATVDLAETQGTDLFRRGEADD